MGCQCGLSLLCAIALRHCGEPIGIKCQWCYDFLGAKLQALKQATKQGWDDIAAGRHTVVADAQLEDFIGQLGQHASDKASAT